LGHVNRRCAIGRELFAGAYRNDIGDKDAKAIAIEDRFRRSSRCARCAQGRREDWKAQCVRNAAGLRVYRFVCRPFRIETVRGFHAVSRLWPLAIRDIDKR
jgi:hypothetical protein